MSTFLYPTSEPYFYHERKNFPTLWTRRISITDIVRKHCSKQTCFGKGVSVRKHSLDFSLVKTRCKCHVTNSLTLTFFRSSARLLLFVSLIISNSSSFILLNNSISFDKEYSKAFANASIKSLM